MDNQELDKWVLIAADPDVSAEQTNQATGLILEAVRSRIYTMARIYSRGPSDTNAEDLFQVGVLGMMHAIKKYDPEQGASFPTYCTLWLKSTMGKYVEKLIDGGFKHVNTQATRTLNANYRKTVGAVREANPGISMEDLAGLVAANEKVSLKSARSVILRRMPSVPLTAELVSLGVRSADEMMREGLVSEPIEDRLNHSIDTHKMIARVKEIMSAMPLRYQDIVEMYYSKEENTLATIGDKHNITRERVRQLNKKALKAIREELEKQDESAKTAHRDRHKRTVLQRTA